VKVSGTNVPSTGRAKAFDLFWQAYPRKVGKGAAREAFARAIRKIDGPDPPARLMAALAAIKPEWAKLPIDKVPHPATWLNQERWEDGDVTPILKIVRTPQQQAEHDARTRAYVERLAREQGLTDVATA